MDGQMNWADIAAACAEEEERFQFESFSRQDALKLGLKLAEAAREYSAGVAIEITINGLSVFRYFPEGTTLDNSLWLARKARTVTLTGVSSLHPNEYAFGGGGFPLILRGVGMIGVIAVSGLTHMEDHMLVTDTLDEVLG